MPARRWLPKSPETPPRPLSITARSSRSPMVPTRPGPKWPTPAHSFRNTEAKRDRPEHAVKAFIVPIMLGFLATGFLATSANAQPLQVIGYAGYLGERELTAFVSKNVSCQAKQYSEPLTMKHVGLCTQDGPEEKTGEMRIDISPSPPVLTARLSIAGI